jgi:hypothetical protein
MPDRRKLTQTIVFLTTIGNNLDSRPSIKISDLPFLRSALSPT